ncbi:MAG: TetR/AcrR family transcriptional regulator [Acidiferrobacteraceae bacterium]
MSRSSGKALARRRGAAPTHEDIAQAALALIDDAGLEAFSTRKLGARIGLQAMSLYHYFPSREALLDAACDRMIAEVPLPDPRRAGWRRGIQQLARRYRAMGHRHLRAIPLLAQRCPASPAMQGFLDALAGLLRKAGLGPAAAAEWLLIQRDYVIGSLMADHAAQVLVRESPGTTQPDPHDPRETLRLHFFSSQARERAFNRGFTAMLDAIERECSRDLGP